MFWRCFASTWALHRDEVFGELIERLATMGIEPLGSVDRAPSLVQKRVWSASNEAEADEAGVALASAVEAAKCGPEAGV